MPFQKYATLVPLVYAFHTMYSTLLVTLSVTGRTLLALITVPAFIIIIIVFQVFFLRRWHCGGYENSRMDSESDSDTRAREVNFLF